MTFEDYKHIIQSYGADPKRWPGDKRALAKAFAAQHPNEVQEILARETALDSSLDTAAAPGPSDILKRRILLSASQTPQHLVPEETPLRSGTALRWRNVAALMLCTFGLGFGGAQFMTTPETSDPVLVAESDSLWAETADDLGLADVYIWAEGT